MAASFFGLGSTDSQPNITSPAAGVGPPQIGVAKSKRRAGPVELAFSDDLETNNDHPLAKLCPEDRQRHRRLKLAEILAQAAARWARRQISNGKEGV